MSKEKNYLFHILAICLAAALWGADGILLTPHLYQLKPGFVVFAIHFLPFMLMNLFLFREYKQLAHFKRNDYLLFGLLALTGGSLGTLAIVKALFLVHFQKLTVVVLLQKLQPVFAICLSVIFLKEQINKRFVLWSVIAVLSAYIMSFGFKLPKADFSDTAMLAYFYAILAALFFGTGTVISRHIATKFSFQTATFYRYGFTAFFMLFWVIFTGDISNYGQTNLTHWLVILIISLTTGSGAIFLYYYGLKKVKASISTICELCFPLTAVVLDLVLHGNQLSLAQWIAVIVLVVSILMISREYR
jgi:drug/metabolite transporter (DMT)-like permease